MALLLGLGICSPAFACGTVIHGSGLSMLAMCPNGDPALFNENIGEFYCADDQCNVMGTAIAYAPGTASSTNTNTNTNTTSPSTASAVQAQTLQDLQKKLQQSLGADAGNQSSTLEDANRVSALGANHAATVGAVFCAEASNKALEDPKLSGSRNFRKLWIG